jgi:membrane protein DedA with SNARE-associated domain
VPSWLESWPFVWLYLFFVLGAALRSQALYWLGRGAAAGALRSRWAAHLDGPRVRRAVRLIERWGMPVVPLSFLTVGLQSAVHGASGLLRLHWLRYTVWSVPGWLVWALVWTGGGTVAVYGAVALAARSPWALAGTAAVVAAGVTVLVVRRRRRRDAEDAVDRLVDQAHDDAAAAS